MMKSDFGDHSLTLALAAAVREVRPAMNSAPRDGRPMWAHLPKNLTDRFAADLRKDPLLRGLEERHFVLPGTVGNIMHEATAAYLLDRAIRGIPAAQIVDSLFHIAETGRCTLVTVQAIAGIRLAARIELSADTWIAPSAELGDSQELRFASASGAISMDGIDRDAAKAIIVVLQQDFPALHPGRATGDEDVERTNDVDQKIEAAISALVAGSGAAPRVRGRFSFVQDPGWPFMASSGGSGRSTPVPPQFDVAGCDPRELARMFSLPWARADPSIHLATNKLRSARESFDDVGRAIELGSCLEILLMHEHAGDNNEISHKISLRAAWLLGRSFEERAAIFSTVREAYTLRSKAVHTGRLPALKTEEKSTARDQVLSATDSLCARLLATLAEDGWPDWKSVTLGALGPSS